MQQNPSINSKYFIDRVENDIVQLARTLSIEHSLPIEDAKIMARQIIQRRLNGLLTPQENQGIALIKKEMTDYLKDNTRANIHQAMLQKFSGKIYELLKTMELL